MKILVTGISGQVGHDLVPLLARHGEVIAADRERLDLAGDPERLRQTLAELSPDLIVNPAAYTAVDKAQTEPQLAHAINALAPGILAQVASARGIPFIHYSTDYVFDGTAIGPYDEQMPCSPVSVYGQSKYDGERAVLAAGGRAFILRTSWVYSLRGRNFLATMARLAGERAELRVVDDQIGAPTTSRAIAHASESLVEQLLRGANIAPGVYHMTCAGQTSWCGFARAIVKRLGPIRDALGMPPSPMAPPVVTAITTADFPTPTRRPANSVLSNQKLLTGAGIALPAWEHALDDLLASHRSAPPALRQ